MADQKYAHVCMCVLCVTQHSGLRGVVFCLLCRRPCLSQRSRARQVCGVFLNVGVSMFIYMCFSELMFVKKEAEQQLFFFCLFF